MSYFFPIWKYNNGKWYAMGEYTLYVKREYHVGVPHWDSLIERD